MKQPARNIKFLFTRSLVVVCFILGLVAAILATSSWAQSTQPATTQATTQAGIDQTKSDLRALATGTAEEYWIAVSKPRATTPTAAPNVTPTSTSKFESTLYRRAMGDKKFSVIARLPQRVDALSRWGSRAVVLLENGQWLSVWPGGTGSGLPLPGGVKIITLAADDNDVWALATVAGGIDVARGQVLAATRPATTRATTLPNADLAAGAVLYRLAGASWEPVAQLPINYDTAGRVERATMQTVTRGKLLAAVETAQAGAIIVGINTQTGEVSPAVNLPAGLSPTLFAGAHQEPFVWLRSGPDADRGAVLPWVEGAFNPAEGRLGKIELPNSNNAAITTAFGYVRVLAPNVDGTEIVERRYGPQDLTSVGAAEPLATLPPPDEAPPWSNYLNIGVIVLLALSIMASLRHRDDVRLSLARKDRPRPAGIWIRMSAATVDLLPIIVGAVILYLRTEPNEYMPTTFASTIPELIAIGIYLLHTTVSELIFSRTLGKWIFGLRVVNLQGNRPGFGAILMRNGLRIIELVFPFLLPLSLILSPLRQRTGDAAAGTMVIDIAKPTMLDEPVEE